MLMRTIFKITKDNFLKDSTKKLLQDFYHMKQIFLVFYYLLDHDIDYSLISVGLHDLSDI